MLSGMESMAPEFRLLLACARVHPSGEDKAAIRKILAEGIDWTRFARKAVDHGLAGRVAHALAGIAPDLVPADIFEALRMSLDQTRRRNLALFDELVSAIEALTKGGVETIPLGGLVLAIRDHGNFGFCVSRNLDLVVRDSDIAQAISILRSLGYDRKIPSSEIRPNPAPDLYGGEIMRKESQGVMIKLHARLAPVTMALDIDYAALWRRARHKDLLGRTFLTLAPEDELLILAIQGGKDIWWDVKWACDIASLIASHPQFDEVALLERARSQGSKRMMLLATALAHRCFGSTIPAAIAAAECTDASITPMVGRIVTHWQNERAGSPTRKMLVIGRLRLHDGVVRQARYVARTLFLPRPNEVVSMPLSGILGPAFRVLKVAYGIAALPLSRAYRRVLVQAERWRDALASSDFVSALLPAAAERRRHRDACAQAKRIVTTDPNNAAAWDVFGDALFGLKRYKKAIACYERAIAITPEEVSIWMKRSTALEALGMRADLPVDTSRLQDANAWAVRAGQFWALHRLEKAAEASDRALEVDPHNISAASIGIQSRLMTCDWRKREEDKQKILDGLRRDVGIAAPFVHRCMCDSETDSLVLARLWTRKFSQAKPLWRGEIYRHDRIRVAYVSPDLRDHVVPDVIAGCFEEHDRTRFETFAISTGPNDGSEMRRRLEAAFDQFIDARAMKEDRVAAMLREWEVDIAIDLYGSPDAKHTEIFAHRPAPLQVNYLGYPGTKGAFLDYIIADPMLIPPENRPFYSEQAVYLPHTYMPTDSKRADSAKMFSRADAGLPETGFVFACHHPAGKIGPEMFDIWMRLLHAVDGSVLWFRGTRRAVITNLWREARARGIAPERLAFAPHLPDLKDHLARLSLADLFLDALPFNAHSSGCDALRAGLPVLTCLGNAFPGRVGASLLQAIGLPELIATSLAEYEDLALALARDPERLAAIKAKLMRNRDTEPLFDTPRFTRYLESAYITMWERAQRGEPPKSFSVPSLL